MFVSQIHKSCKITAVASWLQLNHIKGTGKTPGLAWISKDVT